MFALFKHFTLHAYIYAYLVTNRLLSACRDVAATTCYQWRDWPEATLLSWHWQCVINTLNI